MAASSAAPRQAGSNLRPYKYEQIDIWRREVASADALCACSEPAMRPREGTQRGLDTVDEHQSGETSLVVPTKMCISQPGRDRNSLREHGTSMLSPSRRCLDAVVLTPEMAEGDIDSNNSHEDHTSQEAQERESEARRKSVMAWTVAKSWRREPREGDCILCAAPTDDIAYEVFDDGSGLVRSCRSVHSIWLGDTSQTKPKRKKTLLKAVSQVFRVHHHKRSEPQQTMPAPDLENASRDRHTDMYSNLRQEHLRSLDGVAADETDETPSDDSAGKRPRITIQKSAARLLRAQRLLDRQLGQGPRVEG